MKSIFVLFAVLIAVSARADDSFDAKGAAAMLQKSGSFATCSLDGRDIEDALKAISEAYSGKFTIQLSLPDTAPEVSFKKVCFVLTAR